MLTIGPDCQNKEQGDFDCCRTHNQIWRPNAERTYLNKQHITQLIGKIVIDSKAAGWQNAAYQSSKVSRSLYHLMQNIWQQTKRNGNNQRSCRTMAFGR